MRVEADERGQRSCHLAGCLWPRPQLNAYPISALAPSRPFFESDG